MGMRRKMKMKMDDTSEGDFGNFLTSKLESRDDTPYVR